jgi:hypothetical protein
MREKWVDNTVYFGPDRRRRSASKRWGDRRQSDEAGQLPPLGQMLRRARVQMLGLNTPEERRRVLALLSAAINEAERQQLFQCADSLKQAEQILRASAAKDSSAAEACINDAMNHAAASR